MPRHTAASNRVRTQCGSPSESGERRSRAPTFYRTRFSRPLPDRSGFTLQCTRSGAEAWLGAMALPISACPALGVRRRAPCTRPTRRIASSGGDGEKVPGGAHAHLPAGIYACIHATVRPGLLRGRPPVPATFIREGHSGLALWSCAESNRVYPTIDSTDAQQSAYISMVGLSSQPLVLASPFRGSSV